MLSARVRPGTRTPSTSVRPTSSRSSGPPQGVLGHHPVAAPDSDAELLETSGRLPVRVDHDPADEPIQRQKIAGRWRCPATLNLPWWFWRSQDSNAASARDRYR